MINVIIREEKPEDYEKVCRLIEAAFRDVEESDHTEHLLVKRLRNSEAYIPELSLVAQTPQGEIVGHILLTKAQIVNNTRSFEVLALAPLSVLPTFQRNSIGSRLIQRAHQKAGLPGDRSFRTQGLLSEIRLQKSLSICHQLSFRSAR